MMDRRTLLRAGGQSLAALAVSGARGALAVRGRPAGEARRGGTLLIAANALPPADLDPMVQRIGNVISPNVFEGLYNTDEALQPVPWLAAAVEQPDLVTSIFKVRRDVLFQDGTRLDAGAIKFSMDRIRENRAATRHADSLVIASTTAVDPDTYRLMLHEPYVPFWARLTGGLGAVVSPAAVMALGGEGFNRNPVGTGPFTLGEIQGDGFRLERSDRYWRRGEDGMPLPYLDAVQFPVIADPLERLAALVYGKVHVADVPFAFADVVIEDPELVYAEQPGYDFNGLWLTIDRPPFNVTALRQAVQFAVNRELLSLLVYAGNRQPAHGPIPPPLAWAMDPSFRPYMHDPARARAKLAEGGMPDGFEFTAWAFDSPSNRLVLSVIQESLGQAGITMRTQFARDFAEVVALQQSRESNAYYLSFGSGVDPDGVLSSLFLQGSAFNTFPYENGQVSALITQARRTADMQQRGNLYRQTVALIMEDSPLIFLLYGTAFFAGSRRVQNWFLGAKATTGYSEYWLEP